ncbi:MAG: SpoIID/LytB domain-containing protein, partial [Gaiellales bacterium]
MARRLSAILALLAVAGGAQPAGASTLFTLTGHGWGHGIGMSQYGSLGYAEHGWRHGAILAHYYTGAVLGKLASPFAERVLLAADRPRIDVTVGAGNRFVANGGAVSRSLPAGPYRVVPGLTAGRLRVQDRSTGAFVLQNLAGQVEILPGPTPLRFDGGADNGWAAAQWRGFFRVIRTGPTALSLVDVVGLESYLRGVVPSEVPASWPAQALQTQAVAARSYAVATAKHADPSSLFDAYCDTRSQVYGPIAHEDPRSDAAVTATAGQVMKYQGQVIPAFFSSSSGGRTSSLSASWGAPDRPYLTPVADPYDGASGANPNHTWAPRVFTPAALGTALGTGGSVTSVDHTIDLPSQRVLQVAVHLSTGATVDETAGTVFSRLGLRSTYFRILETTLAAPRTSTSGQPLSITGRLWPKPITKPLLQVQLGANPVWRTLPVTLPVGADGRFTVTRAPIVNVRFRLVRPGAVSPVTRILVHPALTLSAVGANFAGTMRPKLVGATVTLQRQVGSAWATRTTATVGRLGRFRFPTPVSAGMWRAWFAGDAAHAAGGSPVASVAAVAHLPQSSAAG